MKFYDITDDLKVFPGEYVLHVPTNQIALVGAYNAKAGSIKAMVHGKMIRDEVANFQKIHLEHKERKAQRKASGCKGCGK